MAKSSSTLLFICLVVLAIIPLGVCPSLYYAFVVMIISSVGVKSSCIGSVAAWMIILNFVERVDNMSKIVGIRKVSFTGSDGGLVTGFHVHLSTPFYPGAKNSGIGEQVERVFVSERKLEDALICYGSPAALVGMECELVYNRFGKIASLSFPGEL